MASDSSKTGAMGIAVAMTLRKTRDALGRRARAGVSALPIA